MKIVQICAVPATDEHARCLYALTEDGKLYMRGSESGRGHAIESPEDQGDDT
jgi:hypothetical protein